MGVITAHGRELKEMRDSYVNGCNGQVCPAAGEQHIQRPWGRACWASSRGSQWATPPEQSRAGEAEDEFREEGWGGLEDHMGLARCSKAFGFNTIMIYTKIKVKLLEDIGSWASLMAQMVMNLPAMWETPETLVPSRSQKILWRRKWQPTPVFFLENPMDRGAWQATVQRVTKSQTTTEQLSTQGLEIPIYSNIRSIRTHSKFLKNSNSYTDYRIVLTGYLNTWMHIPK